MNKEVKFHDLLYGTYLKLLERVEFDNITLEDVVYKLLMEMYINKEENIDNIKHYCIELGNEIGIYNVKAHDIFEIMINGKDLDISEQINNYNLIDIPYIDDDTVAFVYLNENGNRCISVRTATTSKKQSKNKAALIALKCMGTVTKTIGINESRYEDIAD